MDVLALCETKMKGKGEVAFVEVTVSVWGRKGKSKRRCGAIVE